MSDTANIADVYKQVGIGLSLYRNQKEREAGRHLFHLATGAEWAAGFTPDGSRSEDNWMWDALREAIRAEGGAVRRGNAGGGFTETYLDGDVIRTRQIPVEEEAPDMSKQPHPIPARAVARMLCEHLEKSDTSVHWVNVAGESSLDVSPKVQWPEEGDPMFNLMLQHGHSEGMLIHVMAQRNRYKPEEAQPILLIKMLGGTKKVCGEMPLIAEFLDSLPQRLEELRGEASYEQPRPAMRE